MTISATTGPWVYNGDGATTAFTYDNKIFADTDLKVYVDGSLQTITTHYTVSGVGEETGGKVTFVTAPGSGTDNVLIVLDVPDTQSTEFPVAGPFPSQSVETALDRLTILVQQLVAQQLRGLTAITDDAVHSFTPARSTGIIIIEDGSSEAGIFFYRADASPALVNLGTATTNIAVTTGALTGTTGSDGKLTISAHTDGKVYIENRRGGTRTVIYTVLNA